MTVGECNSTASIVRRRRIIGRLFCALHVDMLSGYTRLFSLAPTAKNTYVRALTTRAIRLAVVQGCHHSRLKLQSSRASLLALLTLF